MSRWGVVLEYVRDLMGLGWLYSSLVLLGLIRDKGRLVKPLYIRRADVSI